MPGPGGAVADLLGLIGRMVYVTLPPSQSRGHEQQQQRRRQQAEKVEVLEEEEENDEKKRVWLLSLGESSIKSRHLLEEEFATIPGLLLDVAAAFSHPSTDGSYSCRPSSRGSAMLGAAAASRGERGNSSFVMANIISSSATLRLVDHQHPLVDDCSR